MANLTGPWAIKCVYKYKNIIKFLTIDMAAENKTELAIVHLPRVPSSFSPSLVLTDRWKNLLYMRPELKQVPSVFVDCLMNFCNINSA